MIGALCNVLPKPTQIQKTQWNCEIESITKRQSRFYSSVAWESLSTCNTASVPASVHPQRLRWRRLLHLCTSSRSPASVMPVHALKSNFSNIGHPFAKACSEASVSLLPSLSSKILSPCQLLEAVSIAASSK